jgi:hypothetical protein
MLWVLWSWYPWALEGLRLEYGHERFFRYLNGDDDIQPPAKRKRPCTGNKEPTTIPKTIHNILSGREDGEVSKNAYLDATNNRECIKKIQKGESLGFISSL